MMNKNKKLALVIEDDYDASIIFSAALEALENIDLEVEVIHSGKLALKRLSEVVPDLVLLDLHLPEVDGAEILASIRADERLKDTPVIVITADPGFADIVMEKTDLVLLKPTTFSQVKEFASRILMHKIKQD